MKFVVVGAFSFGHSLVTISTRMIGAGFAAARADRWGAVPDVTKAARVCGAGRSARTAKATMTARARRGGATAARVASPGTTPARESWRGESPPLGGRVPETRTDPPDWGGT